MKAILKSLVVIGLVAGLTIGATRAFFSDKETSIGNTFTAGTIDLKIDNECYYNGKKCIWVADLGKYRWEGTAIECTCTWGEKDLDESDLFFDFKDVKPGDYGEDTVSLHVLGNDAWACATLGPLTNNDNNCNEPECEAEGGTWDVGKQTCTGGCGAGEGELGDNLYFRIWADLDCDNVLDQEEPILTEGPANGEPLNGVTWPIADSVTGTELPLKASTRYCLGAAWSIDSAVGNIIQSDSVSGNIEFYAEQYRNNPGFDCRLIPAPTPTPKSCATDGDCPVGQRCVENFCQPKP